MSLVSVAVISIAASWWYSRRVQVGSVSITAADVLNDAASLLKLGFAFMVSGFLTMGAAYAVRLILARHVSLEAAGLYPSAWALSGLYVGYILQAMGTDFYPQLVALANNHDRCNRLVNDQARVSLLLAAPGVIATLTFAPFVISLLYSAQFAGAVEVMRWICLSMAMRVMTWPVGYISVAKNRQLLLELAPVV